jgi:Holliday junction DNA helicase RuvB
VKDRPTNLGEIVGQEALVNQLRMVVAGAQIRGTRVPHALLVGPSGHGKTSLASVIAGEIGAELVMTTGVMLKKPADLVGLLVKAAATPHLVFIDEVHALPRPVMETLYTVMEDGRVDVLAGSGMETVAYSIDLPNLTICGATTRPGLLTEPMRQRFGFIGEVSSYSDLELAEIVRRSWAREGVEYAEGEPLQVASRAKSVPRRALALGERVLDYAAVMGSAVTEGTTDRALSAFGIDSLGLDSVDHAYLQCLVSAGRTLGLDSVAASLNVDPRTLSDDHEPHLIRAGYLARCKSGRLALPAAYDLVGAA